MKELKWEAVATGLGLAISAAFMVAPGPYTMGAFTFVAQPLFLLSAVSYTLAVVRELIRRDVI